MLPAMEWLNYHHLLYFWLVAREGSLAGASAELRLAQSTVSKQIHQLEERLGHALFTRAGRKLTLTDSGRVVFRYADEIFSLGRELLDTLADRPAGAAMRVTVGVADIVPKLLAERVLAEATRLPQPMRLVCREGPRSRLLADLALHELDLVLSDAPADPGVKVKAFSHLLGESDVSFFARPELLRGQRRRFPARLAELPVLLPTENTVLRRSLDQWLEARGIRPRVVAEFEDGALLGVFGMRGQGVFPAPTVIRAEVEAQYQVKAIGRAPEVVERLYAITVERRIEHPAAKAICDAARTHVFSREPLRASRRGS